MGACYSLTKEKGVWLRLPGECVTTTLELNITHTKHAIIIVHVEDHIQELDDKDADGIAPFGEPED